MSARVAPSEGWSIGNTERRCIPHIWAPGISDEAGEADRTGDWRCCFCDDACAGDDDDASDSADDEDDDSAVVGRCCWSRSRSTPPR